MKYAILVAAMVGLADYFGGYRPALYVLMAMIIVLGNSVIERSVDLDSRIRELEDKLDKHASWDAIRDVSRRVRELEDMLDRPRQ